MALLSLEFSDSTTYVSYKLSLYSYNCMGLLSPQFSDSTTYVSYMLSLCGYSCMYGAAVTTVL